MSRRPLHQRLIATAAVLVAILFGAAKLYAAVIADRSSSAPGMQTFGSGSMSVSNSSEGTAIFSLSNMAPGRGNQGEVTIGNTGTGPGALTLSSFDLSDTPGIYGGTLSKRLDLQIFNVTSSAAIPVYAGKLGSMPEQQLGALAAGDSRSYRFAVSMSDGGAPSSPYVDDNLYQRATASLGYDWTLTETTAADGPVPPDPDPDSPGGDGGSPPPVPVPPVAREQPCSERLVGGAQADRLTGTAADDLIYGFGGTDAILGMAGDDCAFGGSGGDRIYGGPGSDRLRGGLERDLIDGGSGPDVVFARDGESDSIDCGRGQDTVFVDEHDSARGCEIAHRLYLDVFDSGKGP